MADKKSDTPLRGDAAWQAEKQRIAANNKAAHKRSREQRTATENAGRDRELEAARREAASLPVQPGQH